MNISWDWLKLFDCLCIFTRERVWKGVCETARHACSRMYMSVPSIISNEQPANEGGPCSFHSSSQEIITLCLKLFFICTTLTVSFSRLYKNPILFLSLFLLSICCTFTPAHIWREITPPFDLNIRNYFIPFNGRLWLLEGSNFRWFNKAFYR